MKRIQFQIFGFIFYVLTIVYPTVRLIYWLTPNFHPAYAALLLFLAIPLFPPFVLRTIRSAKNRTMSQTILTAYGLLFELFIVVAIVELLALTLSLSHQAAGLVALSLWAIVGAVSLWNGQRLAIRRLTLPGMFGSSGKSIVQITDVHIGTRRPKFLNRVVRKIEQLHPDAVLITGDLVDASYVDSDALAPLADLSAPTFFTIGNHERYERCEDIVAWLRNHGVNVLRNETQDANPFQFVGIDDADAENTVQNGLANLQPLENRYRVLLYHRPRGASDASNWGVHLMMCGHTHHGQIFPFGFVVKRFFQPYRGSHEIDGMTLHIAPGTGTWGPILRLGSRNEITEVVFT